MLNIKILKKFKISTNKYLFGLGNKRIAIALVLSIFVVLWQAQIESHKSDLSDYYTRHDASGFRHPETQKFFYFFYYLGLYPVTTEYENLDYSREGATRFLEEKGSMLTMKYLHVAEWGDNLRIVLYLPHALLTKTANHPSVLLFNELFFTLALIFLLFSMFYIQKPFLGVLLVLLLGSNPFQLYEVYVNENIFSLQITLMIFLLALNIPLAGVEEDSPFPYSYAVIASIVSGTILGTFSHVRFELISLVVSCLLVYFFLPAVKASLKVVEGRFLSDFWNFCIKNKPKFLTVFFFLISYALVNTYWKEYFNYKYKEAYSVIERGGGTTLDNPDLRIVHHTIWHTIFAGLGDFDKKYGYLWSDVTAYNYATPILISRGVLIPKDIEILSVMPEYNEVIKEKVLSDIGNDLGWYLSIIFNRVRVAVQKATPLSVQLARQAFTFQIPEIMFWIMACILVIYLLKKKKWFYLKVIAFSIPVSASIIFMYSGRNGTSVSVFHIFFVVVFVYILAEVVRDLVIARDNPLKIRKR